MKTKTAFNVALALVTMVGALPLMAQTDSEGDSGCISQCDQGAFCCSAHGTEVCCSYNLHQCCHSNTTQCYTAVC